MVAIVYFGMRQSLNFFKQETFLQLYFVFIKPKFKTKTTTTTFVIHNYT